MTDNHRFVSDRARPSALSSHSEASEHLRQDYAGWQALFDAQPLSVQRLLEAQARQLADAITQRQHVSQIRFTLPERILLEVPRAGQGQLVVIPDDQRAQLAGGLLDRIADGGAAKLLRQRLAELEQSPERAVAVGAGLLQHATARHMVHGMLPAGRNVAYTALPGEEIPSIPIGDSLEPDSAITAATDAIAEEGSGEAGRGELLVPYVPAARRFYLPQWVAFDDQDRLLVNSAGEAEALIASMQRFLDVLHAAVALAPYLVADDEYQRKRYGMLGQLVNQGRALARHETGEIIGTIQARAAAHDLNRGLSLSLPYFDDQALRLQTHDFTVIPAGRIMFVAAFVVRAAQQEQAKAAQDTRLSPSTRKHLLGELEMLERAFEGNRD
ncbi:MAG TPA: hypothetical protein VJG32_15280 [Anaerolineae bacterium]|nr:hypothetical protein [Anaerolineae bacterium]